MDSFEAMLTGGHPNSLGRTVDVVDLVLADPTRLETLYQCYFSADAVVRLRTSSAMKRLWQAQPALLVPYIDRFLHEVAQIDQPSAQWTLAKLVDELQAWLTPTQQQAAIRVLKTNLTQSGDWIVIINTLDVLSRWSTDHADLKGWLKPHIERLSHDPRKSVARRAANWAKTLY